MKPLLGSSCVRGFHYMGTCTGRSFGVPERKAKTGSITKYAARIQYQLQNFSIFIFRKSVGLRIIYL